MVSELATPQTRREIKDLKKTSRTDNGLHSSKIQVDFTANLSVPSAISQDSLVSCVIKGNSELLKGLSAV